MFLPVVVLLTVFFSEVHGQCRNGWISYKESCYLFANVLADWDEAEVLCISLYGGYLAEIEDVDENNFVKQEAKTAYAPDPRGFGFWIGGSDVEVEGEYRWMKSDHRFTFTDWSGTGPSNSGGHEDCVHMAPQTFQWNDLDCSTKLYYICERPIGLSGGGGDLIG